jgi:hypothetical protein
MRNQYNHFGVNRLIQRHQRSFGVRSLGQQPIFDLAFRLPDELSGRAVSSGNPGC